jgi:hypothetical protein
MSEAIVIHNHVTRDEAHEPDAAEQAWGELQAKSKDGSSKLSDIS